jgi:FixJ family two-component response regulator
MTEADPIVCVADDDPSIRDTLRSLIRSVEHRVETFGSAREFLTKPFRNQDLLDAIAQAIARPRGPAVACGPGDVAPALRRADPP